MTRLRELPALKGLLVLAMLIAAMFAMLALKTQAGAVSSAVTFATIGFVVLAAYAMAELATMVGLPRVTGYILAGIGLGPSMAALTGIDPPLLSTGVVQDMRVFNDLALALIALEAGLELSLDALKRFKRTLASIILFKIPLSWLLLGGAFVLLALTVLPVAGVAPDDVNALLAIGLVLGALGVGTSPAVSIAVISEAGAKGKTADLVLGFAVFKDVVMVVMLAVAIAIAQILLSDGASFDGAIFLKLGKKILLSVAVGVALGAMLIAWMRWVSWENILMLLVVAYGVNYGVHWLEQSTRLTFMGATLAEGLKLKPLLIFIAAGFTVANFSRFGHALHKPLGMLALPVFVIFFTTAGAGLELEQTIAVLPIALALFAVRGLMMYLSTRFGGALAGEPRPYTNVLWLGFISQAGVALVLLGIAVKELPTIAGPLHQVAFSLIALNLLIGPILLRSALKKGATAADAPARGPAEAPALPRARPLPPAGAPPTKAPAEPRLAEVLRDVEARLETLRDDVGTEIIDRWAADARGRLDDTDSAAAVEPLPIAPLAARLRAHARGLRDLMIDLPAACRAALDDEHLRPRPGMALSARLSRRWLRLRYGLGLRRRRVGLRSLARARVEGPTVVALADLLDRLALAEARRVDLLDHAHREHRGRDTPPTLVRAAARGHVDEVAAALTASLEQTLRQTVDDLAYALRFAGTPMVDARSVRFAGVASDVDEALHRLDDRGAEWDEAVARIGRRGHLRAVLLTAEREVGQRSRAALERWGVEERDVMLGVVRQALSTLAATEQTLAAKCSGVEDTASARAEIEAAVEGLGAQVNERLVPHIAEMRLTAEERGPLKELEAAVASLVPDLPAALELAPTALDLDLVRVPDDVPAESKPVAATIEKYLAGEMTWGMTETRAEDEELTARVAQRLLEVAGSVTVGLSAGVQELCERDRGDAALGGRVLSVARGALSRAQRLIEDLLQRVEGTLQKVPKTILESNDDAFLRVYQRLLGEPADTEDAGHDGRSERLRELLRRVGQGASGRWRRLAGNAVATYRRFISSDIARRARLRSGSEQVDPAHMAADVRLLAPDGARLEVMPYVLARLFTPATLDTHHLLTGVEEAVAALQAAHGAFGEGHPTSVLIRGQAGSGKTSMARVTLRGLVGRRLVDVVIGAEHRGEAALCEAIGSQAGAFAARTFPALQRALSGGKYVVFLDGLEQLFVRSPAGLALVQRLLRVIVATRHQALWVVSVDEPTARLLEPLCDLPGHFTHHLRLAPLDAAQLGRLIEARSRLSGYDIVWPSVDEGRRALWRRLTRRASAEEQRARFLAQLAAASGGNIRDALSLFINAIDEVDSEQIRLRPVAVPALSWFDQLGRDAHRLLAAIVLSGTLGHSEALAALRWQPERLAAARARVLGAALAVAADREGDRIRVAPYAWRRVVAALSRRNHLLGA